MGEAGGAEVVGTSFVFSHIGRYVMRTDMVFYRERLSHLCLTGIALPVFDHISEKRTLNCSSQRYSMLRDVSKHGRTLLI